MNRNDKKSYIKEADKYFESKEYEKTIELLSKIIESEEFDICNDSFLYFKKSAAFGSIEDYDKAINDISIYIKHNPNDYDGYCYKGYCYWCKYDYDKAIENYTISLNISPNLEAFHSRGWCYCMQKNFHKALPDFKMALALSPDNVEACEQIGFILLNLHRKDEAIIYLEKSVELGSENSDIFFNIGHYFSKRNDIKAIEAYEKAIFHGCNYAHAFFMLACCYYTVSPIQNLGSISLVIKYLEESLKLVKADDELEKEIQNLLTRARYERKKFLVY